MDDVEIRNNEAAGRYELSVGGRLGSFAEYRIVDDRIVFPHTETMDEFRGRGLAAKVVQAALDDARASGRQVVPACWFVAEFIDEHPEYRPLVSGADPVA